MWKLSCEFRGLWALKHVILPSCHHVIITYVIVSSYHLVILLSCWLIILSSCHHVILSSRHLVILSSCHHVITSSCHHVIMSSCNHVIMSSCHHVIMSSCHHFIRSSCHYIIMSSCEHLYQCIIMSSCHHVIISSFEHVIIWACHHMNMTSCEHVNMWTYQQVIMSSHHHVIKYYQYPFLLFGFFLGLYLFFFRVFILSWFTLVLHMLSSCLPLPSLLSSSLCYHLSSLSPPSPLGDEQPLVSQVKFLVQNLESRVHIFYRVFQKLSHSNL